VGIEVNSFSQFYNLTPRDLSHLWSWKVICARYTLFK